MTVQEKMEAGRWLQNINSQAFDRVRYWNEQAMMADVMGDRQGMQNAIAQYKHYLYVVRMTQQIMTEMGVGYVS